MGSKGGKRGEGKGKGGTALNSKFQLDRFFMPSLGVEN